MEKCSECHYYKKENKVCRRYPTDHDHGYFLNLDHIDHDDYWCGKFEQKEIEEE